MKSFRWIVFAALLFALLTNSQQQIPNGEEISLSEDEENILAALFAQQTVADSEDPSTEANKFKQALSGQRRDEDNKNKRHAEGNEFSTKEESNPDMKKSVEPEKSSTAITRDEILDLDTWTLMKRQIASDLAPFLMLIPAPVKLHIIEWSKDAKVLFVNVLYGALKPTLLISSKLLSQASGVLLSFVDELERQRSVQKSTTVSTASRANKNRLLDRAEKKLKKKKRAQSNKTTASAEARVIDSADKEQEEVLIEI